MKETLLILQSLPTGAIDSYHKQASPARLRQNLPYFPSCVIPWKFIQSLLHSKWLSAPSPSFAEKIGHLSCKTYARVAGPMGSWNLTGAWPSLSLLDLYRSAGGSPWTWSLWPSSLSDLLSLSSSLPPSRCSPSTIITSLSSSSS